MRNRTTGYLRHSQNHNLAITTGHIHSDLPGNRLVHPQGPSQKLRSFFVPSNSRTRNSSNSLVMAGTRVRHLCNQRMTRPAFEFRRLQRFRRFAHWVREHSRYYAKIMARHRIDPANCVPEDFPVLTKRDVTEHFDEIVTAPSINRSRVEAFLCRSQDPHDLFDDQFFVLHTSGSSGEIGIYVYERADMIRGLTKNLRISPVRMRKTPFLYLGATRGHFAGVTMISALKNTPVARLLDIELVDINDPLDKIVAAVQRHQPEHLAGYTTALCLLAEQKLHSALRIQPRVITAGGEPMSSAQRSLIRRAFGVDPSSLYACTEHLTLGLAKPEYGGMYLMEDDLIFELGEDYTCVTNLFNHTMPLIRYRMEDVLRPEEDAAGFYPFTKVGEIVGRNEHTLVFINHKGQKTSISPIVIVEFFAKHLARFQLKIIDYTSFLFYVVPEPGIRAYEKATMLADVKLRLFKILEAKQLDNVRFEIVEVDDLQANPRTGKFHLIIPPHRPKA